MKKLLSVLFVLCFAIPITKAQDTFSIVAVDSVTGEVGSAGASCVDLFQTSFSDDSFLGQLIPNVGAINTQAFYNASNQSNATDRINLGETPSQIIDWLVVNDVQSQPQIRQYGIAALINGSPQAAAHTGSATNNYKNHIVGPNYAIQGNILLGQEVLDSMESRFLREPGDLACKLMAAMQGANMVGADTRCSANGTSSLFAFLKVAHPTDVFGSPSFKISVRTSSNAGIEPIDSLQTKFDAKHNCIAIGMKEPEDIESRLNIFPNPTNGLINIKGQDIYHITITDINGITVLQLSNLENQTTLDLTSQVPGVYFVKVATNAEFIIKRIVIKER